VDGQREFLVSDLGASFGKTGAVTTRSKGNLKDYEHSSFITAATVEYLSFKMATRPSPMLKPFERTNYRTRAQMELITKKIPRADALWIGQQLTRLTEEQIRDAFRAAHYPPVEVERYAKVLETRIAELNARAQGSGVRAEDAKWRNFEMLAEPIR